MRLAVSENGKTFDIPKIVPTPQNFEEGMEVFESLAKELAGGQKVLAAAGGIAGPFNKEKTVLLNAPHLLDWVGKPLGERLRRILDCPVYLNNDAALGGLGEAVEGAGKNEKIVAYLTFGTGVGGARIVDGKIDNNAFGFEPGHQILMMTPAFVPQSGTSAGKWESYVSGSGFEKRYQKKPAEITDPKIWEEAARWLAYGLHNVIMLWSPNAVILGGPMILGRVAISLPVVVNYLKEINKTFPEMPLVKKAELGDLVGLYGALVYLKQQLVIEK